MAFNGALWKILILALIACMLLDSVDCKKNCPKGKKGKKCRAKQNKPPPPPPPPPTATTSSPVAASLVESTGDCDEETMHKDCKYAGEMLQCVSHRSDINRPDRPDCFIEYCWCVNGTIQPVVEEKECCCRRTTKPDSAEDILKLLLTGMASSGSGMGGLGGILGLPTGGQNLGSIGNMFGGIGAGTGGTGGTDNAQCFMQCLAQLGLTTGATLTSEQSEALMQCLLLCGQGSGGMPSSGMGGLESILGGLTGGQNLGSLGNMFGGIGAGTGGTGGTDNAQCIMQCLAQLGLTTGAALTSEQSEALMQCLLLCGQGSGMGGLESILGGLTGGQNLGSLASMLGSMGAGGMPFPGGVNLNGAGNLTEVLACLSGIGTTGEPDSSFVAQVLECIGLEGGISGIMPEGFPGGMPGGIPGGMPGGMSGFPSQETMMNHLEAFTECFNATVISPELFELLSNSSGGELASGITELFGNLGENGGEAPDRPSLMQCMIIIVETIFEMLGAQGFGAMMAGNGTNPMLQALMSGMGSG